MSPDSDEDIGNKFLLNLNLNFFFFNYKYYSLFVIDVFVTKTNKLFFLFNQELILN